MDVILPKHAPYGDWKDVTGFDREELIEKVLQGGWFNLSSPICITTVGEIEGAPLTLGFDCYVNRAALDRAQANPGAAFYSEAYRRKRKIDDTGLTFAVSFCHDGDPTSMEIRDVYFRGNKTQGLGKTLIARLDDVAIETGHKRMFVVPGLEGTFFWTVHGAKIQDQSILPALLSRAEKIVDGKVSCFGWDEEDFETLSDIIDRKKLGALQEFAARKDLWVEGQRINAYLYKDETLGVCVFDRSDRWTRDCIRSIREEVAARTDSAAAESESVGKPRMTAAQARAQRFANVMRSGGKAKPIAPGA